MKVAGLFAGIGGFELPPEKWTGLSRSTLGVRWTDIAQS